MKVPVCPLGKGTPAPFLCLGGCSQRHIPLPNSVNESGQSPHPPPPQSAKHGSLAHAGDFSRNFPCISVKKKEFTTMKKTVLSLMLALCLLLSSSIALATTFTDAHGNEIELDDSLEAYTTVVLSGADNAAVRKKPTSATSGRTPCAGSPFPETSMPLLTRTTLPTASTISTSMRITLSRSGTAATCVPILRKANSARRSWLKFCPSRTRSPSSI